MRYLTLLLIVLLGLSLAANAYLYSLLVINNSAANQDFFAPLRKSAPNEIQLAQKTALEPIQKPHASQPKTPVDVNTGAKIPSNKSNSIYKQIDQWIRNDEIDSAKIELQQYLKLHPYDIDFLLLEAELIAREKPPLYAIQTYYELKNLPLNSSQAELINENIKMLSERSIIDLQRSNLWQILANFLESLLVYDPTNEVYLFSLAEAYGNLAELTLMENVLSQLPQNNSKVKSLRAMFYAKNDVANQQQQTQRNYQSAIALKNNGSHYMTPFNVEKREFELLLDTGASNTVLSLDAFQQLDDRQVSFIGEYLVNTAAGKVMAPIYRLATANFADYPLRDISVIVLPLEDFAADGLLGMNILSQFDFKIDQQNNRLLLSKY